MRRSECGRVLSGRTRPHPFALIIAFSGTRFNEPLFLSFFVFDYVLPARDGHGPGNRHGDGRDSPIFAQLGDGWDGWDGWDKIGNGQLDLENA